jgi:hypothetical protein
VTSKNKTKQNKTKPPRPPPPKTSKERNRTVRTSGEAAITVIVAPWWSRLHTRRSSRIWAPELEEKGRKRKAKEAEERERERKKGRQYFLTLASSASSYFLFSFPPKNFFFQDNLVYTLCIKT